MYRVLPAPVRNRVLEICFKTPPILAGFSWPGERAVACHLQRGVAKSTCENLNAADLGICVADYQRELPFPPASFDLVICHRSLDRLAAEDDSFRDPRALEAFIARASNVLAAGGILAVCATNATAITRWRRRWGRHKSSISDLAAGSLSPAGWRKLLMRSGLQRTQSFMVLPDADAPLRLVNTDTDLSRIGFRREIESIRASLSFPGYLLRRALVEMSLYRHLEESVLAWGHRS